MNTLECTENWLWLNQQRLVSQTLLGNSSITFIVKGRTRYDCGPGFTDACEDLELLCSGLTNVATKFKNVDGFLFSKILIYIYEC